MRKPTIAYTDQTERGALASDPCVVPTSKPMCPFVKQSKLPWIGRRGTPQSMCQTAALSGTTSGLRGLASRLLPRPPNPAYTDRHEGLSSGSVSTYPRCSRSSVARESEASAPLKAAVNGLSGIAVVNQGLLDNRERSGAVQTLTYLRDHGVTLEPDGLMVEAMRNGWGGTGPEDLRKIAVDLNDGKALRFTKRITPERLEQWVQTK